MAELKPIVKPTYDKYPEFDLDLKMRAKVYTQEGDLGYIYSPFRNMQASEDFKMADGTQIKKGQLLNFNTEALNFNLENPVDIQVQPSYDGTVNLILNDDLNPPRIINSRFSVVEDKRFNIVDRRGNNDTNIYKTDKVDLETRLFKNYLKIPHLDFLGLQEGGNLKTGVYSFYFKYTDADGNESDIIAESGVIPVHEGGVNDPMSISGGIQDRNCNKIIKLKLSNLDTSYDYINVYYCRTTGQDSFGNNSQYIKITDKKILSGSSLDLTITGFENILEISPDLLNVEYNMVTRVKTQAQTQNMLFFGNVDKPTIPFQDLEDLSLRIHPCVNTDVNIGKLSDTYKPVDGNAEHIEYFNMKTVHDSTGYWNNEIYRFGVVYILLDDSLSPVFNVRGCNNLDYTTTFQNPPMYLDEKRNYISLSEDGYYQENTQHLENTKGVVRFRYTGETQKTKDGIEGLHPIGVSFKVTSEVQDEIKKYSKGFFFVRQKRIPTTLAQGLTIGVDQESYLPCLKNSRGFFTESFMDDNRRLTNDFERHLIYPDTSKSKIKFQGILAPELTVNKQVSSGLFNNSDFVLSNSILDNSTDVVNAKSARHFTIPSYKNNIPLDRAYKTKLVQVLDSAPLKSTEGCYFSSLAGMAEDASKFKYFGVRDKTTGAKNLVRGCFASFLGSSQVLPDHKLLNIHIPGYDYTLMDEYFKIRFNSLHSYYAIGNRYDFNLLDSQVYTNIAKKDNTITITEYRGDCYINTVTVRMNRNFIDPETPVNDQIVDFETWQKNYLEPSDQDDKKDNSKINRGDVNAVQLGHWVTFKVCSNINLALRSLDSSEVTEQALFGQPRSFYPVSEMSPRAEGKMAESEVFNNGYSITTSMKEYTGLPDVPYIKNIFDNRIMFSTKHVNDAFQNGYRVFQGLSYQDITRQYGAITKLFDWNGNLLSIFENGVSILAINERALIQTETGDSIHMYGAGVLPEKEQPLSVDFGSRWIDSIIRTPRGVYGVDTEAKKIWRVSNKGFELLSDFKIQKFLNDNLVMDSDEYKPIVGLRNVKTHYDNNKGDIIFTFYNCTRDNDEKWALIYNERLDKWITRTDWTPIASENINNIFLSLDQQNARKISLNAYTLKDNKHSEGIVLTNNVVKPNSVVGTLSIKGYDYYDKYTKTYSIDGQAPGFSIEGDVLKYTGTTPITNLIIPIKVKLSMSGQNAPSFIDFLYVHGADEKFEENHFYKHGQGNVFNNWELDNITPCNWYGRQHGFEFEFIVNEKFHSQKIFDNLKIISNKVQPDELTIEVVGDSYTFKTRDMKSVVHTQKIIDLAKFGRLRGNAHYKEDIWDVQIAPLRGYGRRETRIRDKYAKIRLRYTGEDLAIITLLQTFYTLSYA